MTIFHILIEATGDGFCVFSPQLRNLHAEAKELLQAKKSKGTTCYWQRYRS